MTRGTGLTVRGQGSRHPTTLLRSRRFDQEAAILLLTVVKVALALVPRAVMATRQTTIMRANITAYSTAVGPSSFLKNFTIEGVRRLSILQLLGGGTNEV